jgi:bacteriocin-like protein
MSKDQGKAKPGAKQNPPNKVKQEVDPTELSEEDLNKISGGVGGGSAGGGSDEDKYIKINIG